MEKIYLKRVSDKLTFCGIDHEVINSFCPRFLSSWLRVILFNIQVAVEKKGKFYFSLEIMLDEMEALFDRFVEVKENA